MERVTTERPYQRLDGTNRRDPRMESAGLMNAGKGRSDSVCGSNGSLEEGSGQLLDHVEQPRHFDVSSERGDGSIGTSTCKGAASMKKSVSFWPLVLLIFYSVSGGPFGVEPVVAAGGPLLALAGFMFLPLVWSVPEAMVTAELSSTFPEPAGCVAWVSTAFGPFWGWMEGYCSWVSGVTDNSLYPVLFLDYLVSLLPKDNFLRQDGLGRWGCIIGLNVAMSYLTYRGLRVVGRTAIAIAVFSLLPFVVLTLWGLPGCTMPDSWLSPPDGGWSAVRWGTFLNVMFWNLNYWDSAASFAGEVDNPGKTYPRALFACVVLVVLCNGLPVLVGTGSAAVAAAAAEVTDGTGEGRWSLWVDGYFADVASAVAGRWLGVWVVMAAAAANIGLFEAEMSSDAFQLMGMAERGIVPAVFAKRGPHGISGLAVIFSSTGVAFLGLLDFEAIVEILNLLYCFAELLEFAAFVKLRISHREMYRPYEIPTGTVGVCILLLPASAFVILLATLSSGLTWAVSGVAILIGCALYPGLRLANRRQWCTFRAMTLYDGDIVATEQLNMHVVFSVGVCILLLPASAFVILLATLSSGLTWAVSGVAILIGCALYPGLRLANRRQWCTFRAMTLYDGDIVATEQLNMHVVFSVGVCILLLPASAFVILLATLSSGLTWAVSGVAILIGCALYPGLRLANRRQWCTFRAMTLYDGDIVATEQVTACTE